LEVVDGRVSTVSDHLDQSPAQVLLLQAPPNWEDVYNLYNSPPVETRPYTVLRREGSFEVRRLPRTRVLEVVQWTAHSPSASTCNLCRPVVPGAAFTSRQPSSRTPWFPTRPIIAEHLDAAGDGAATRYTVPIPSRNANEDLPEPVPEPGAEDKGVTMQIKTLPARTVAVCRLPGILPSDQAVIDAAAALADDVAARGYTVAKDDASSMPFQFGQYNTKVGFDSEGCLSIVQYQGTLGPLRRNEVSIPLQV